MIGLVQSWEIVLFGIGVLLLLAEIFVIPGFGVAGISGLVLVAGSLFAALIGNVGLSFPPFAALAPAVGTMAATLVLLIVLMFSLSKYLPKSERFAQLILAPELASASGYVSAETMEELVGRTGVSLTPLRPAGTVDIGGERIDVVTRGEFVLPGTEVEIIRVRGSRVVVRTAPPTA